MSDLLGERIRAAIKRAGLTQVELARRLSVGQQTVSGWANGAREPDAATIARIAEICGVSTDELLGRATPGRADPDPLAPPVPSSVTRAIEAARHGDWEGLARALAESVLMHEHTEQMRILTEQMRIREVEAPKAQAELVAREAEKIARDADRSAQENIRAAVALAANAESARGRGMTPERTAQLLDIIARSGNLPSPEPVPQE